MAGWDRVGRAVRRWWDAPATLEVLATPDGYVHAVTRGFVRFGVIGALLGVPVLALTGTALRGAAPVGALLALPAVSVGLFLWAEFRGLPRSLIYWVVVMVAGCVGGWLGFFGPDQPAVALVVPVGTAIVTVWVPRRWALAAVTVGVGTLTAVTVARDVRDLDELVVPVAFFSYLLLFELSWMLDGVRGLSAELAELNRTLEDRVDEQVAEIEGLGQLRRFLSPQVADAVLAGGDEALLQPHRRRIAVVFCDLRGFTAFSNASEPEEVLDVLEAYYGVVGSHLRAHGATVGPFQGDGILAYFGDPVPCDDPAGTALEMVCELRPPLDDLCRRWEARGFALGYGMGVAYGYATLGTIGFEGRTDYTPLGSVVNLASRLADEAGHGEVLLDGRAHHEVAGRVTATRRDLPLKGFDRPVSAYLI